MNISLTSSWDRIIRTTAHYGTIALIIFLVWGCAAVPKLKEGSEGTYLRLPFVRVLLQNTSSEIVVSGKGSFSVECLKGKKSYVYYSSQPVTFSRSGDGLVIKMGHNPLGDRFDEVLLTPRSGHNFLTAFNQRYRGMLRILPNGNNLRLINIVHVDDYLKGVVPLEIGFTSEPEREAIKAQAVAARTYAISHLEQYPKEPYDLKSDVSDQVYRGVDVEKDLVNEAVDATRGMVMKFHDQLINAYYHSTCGGSTDDIDEVWDRKAEPYLRAVSDSGYCDWSKYARWTESYSVKQLALRLEEYLSAERGRVIRIDRIDDIEITGLTAGGRVAEMTVTTDKGTFNFGKDKVRWVFTRSSNPEMILQSAWFRLQKQFDSQNRLTRVDFVGRGYGHGVGMCQTGAIGMSRAGWKFENILKYYYSHIDLVRLY